MDDWRTIDTAPKNGTRILLAITKKDGTEQRIFAAEYHCEEWRVSRTKNQNIILDKGRVTHWMPLPPDPVNADHTTER